MLSNLSKVMQLIRDRAGAPSHCRELFPGSEE